MKRFILFLFFVLPLYILAQNDPPNIHPEDIKQFPSETNPIWYDNSTTFYNYQGNLLMFTFVTKYDNTYGGYNGFLYVYQLSKDANGNSYFKLLSFNGTSKILFKYPDESHGSTYAAKVVYRAHAFEYNGQVWYHAFIRDRHNYNIFHEHSHYFDCYAQLPLYLESSESCSTYYNTITYKNPPEYYVIKGALQEGDNICFFSHNPSLNKWNKTTAKLNEYNKFQKIEETPWAEGTNFYPELGGIIKYYDCYGNKCYAFNTYDKDKSFSNLSIYKDTVPFVWYDMVTTKDCPAATLIGGTINGNRDIVYGSKECNERFTLFELSTIKTDGVYTIYYTEYCTNGEGDRFPKELATGIVNSVPSRPPYHVNGDLDGKGYYLYSTYDYLPKAFTTLNWDPHLNKKQIDGMQQSVCLFYPYKDNTFYALYIDSDIWSPDMESVVKSTDLNKDSDTVYGKSIRGLWTLTGMLDGAPPCSVDWEEWINNHILNHWPSKLTFTSEHGSSTEVSYTSDDQYSIGASLKFGFANFFSMSEKYKYSLAYKNSQSVAYKTSTKISTEFVLNDKTQDHGYLLWSIPEIQRTSYQVYPWWDVDTLSYPIDSTLQYMFRTIGIDLQIDTVDLSVFPFNIDHPNAVDMAEWEIGARGEIEEASKRPGTVIGPVFWYNNGNPGSELFFLEESDTTNTTESTRAYEAEIGVGMKVPEVFNIGLTAGTEFKYSTENKITTNFGTEIEASLVEMEDGIGINVQDLHLTVYWFRPDPQNGWWFYDSLDAEQYPWYIAYAITSKNAKIELVSPIGDYPIRKSDFIFTWDCVGEELNDFSLFIGTTSSFASSDIVYQQSIGGSKFHNPSNFKPLIGVKYYWTVRGKTSTGEVVWSKTKSFVLKDNISFDNQENLLKAVVYPNPSENKDITVAIDLPINDILKVSLFDLSGRFLYGSEHYHVENEITKIIIPIEDLADGIYFVKIQSRYEIVSKKIIILNR